MHPYQELASNAQFVVRNAQMKQVFIHELSGQISDGFWENARPYDHYKPWSHLLRSPDGEFAADRKVVIAEFGAPATVLGVQLITQDQTTSWGNRFSFSFPRSKYYFAHTELMKVVGGRMLAIARLAAIAAIRGSDFPSSAYDTVQNLILTDMPADGKTLEFNSYLGDAKWFTDEYWIEKRKSVVAFCNLLLGNDSEEEAELTQEQLAALAAEVVDLLNNESEVKYRRSDLRRDLKEMSSNLFPVRVSTPVQE